MGKIYRFDPIIYPFVLWITYDATAEELNEKFPDGDEFGEHFEEFPKDDAGAITSLVTDGETGEDGALIRFLNKRNITFGHVSHEAGHYALCLFKYINESVSLECQEPFCYIEEFVGECCEKVRTGNI